MRLTNNIVIDKAKETGFDLIGFAKAGLLEDETIKYERWLAKGYQAGMEYMSRNIEKRKNVKQILPSAKSVISLALNYYKPDKFSDEKEKGKVSRYAWGKDYHIIIWKMLQELETKLKKVDPEFESVSYVDTGPVMDKAWAVRAGIGWLGKHTNVINREMGSWFFIANIITNAEFEYSAQIPDFCGNCTACIDACPTDAIVQEYVVDANKCISYLTIENKGEIAREFSGKFDGWVFGCDICQDVCPWNEKFSVISSVSEFVPVNKEIPLDEVGQIDEESFKKKYEDSPIKRAKLSGLKRNAAFLKSES